MAVIDRPISSVEQRAGRAALVGALIGLVVVTAAVGVLGLSNGVGGMSAFGLGVFVGVFGGGGFGAMVGASLVAARDQASRSGRDRREPRA